MDRGEAYIIHENYEKGFCKKSFIFKYFFLAMEDFKKAVNAHESSKRAKEALNRCQKLLKRSKKKDYYKILGVKPSAQEKEIIKGIKFFL